MVKFLRTPISTEHLWWLLLKLKLKVFNFQHFFLWSAFSLKYVVLQIIQISFASTGDWKESISQWNVSFERLKSAELWSAVMFHISREIIQISACVQQKVLRGFTFPYFVLSWYILIQSLDKTFPKRIYFFLFLSSSGIWLFKTTSYISKTSILSNKAPLVFFFRGLHVTCKTIITCQSKEKTTS